MASPQWEQAHPFGWPQPSTPGAIDRGIKDTPDRAGFDITGHRHKREQFSESSSNERAPGCRGI